MSPFFSNLCIHLHFTVGPSFFNIIQHSYPFTSFWSFPFHPPFLWIAQQALMPHHVSNPSSLSCCNGFHEFPRLTRSYQDILIGHSLLPWYFHHFFQHHISNASTSQVAFLHGPHFGIIHEDCPNHLRLKIITENVALVAFICEHNACLPHFVCRNMLIMYILCCR